jgi:hypothetical protein
MARFCIAGCGTELKTEDDRTDYQRQFCSDECRNEDKRQKIRDQRARMRTKKRCTTCTQPILDAETWKRLRELAAQDGLDL